MVDHHDAGAVETLGLVHQQVAALVVDVIGNYEALCKIQAYGKKVIGYENRLVDRTVFYQPLLRTGNAAPSLKNH